MAKRVRLIDIAERLNITKVSVSKALRGHPDISRETRELVKKTAAEMGYTPNLLARSLSSQRSHTLGVVVPKIAHTFFSSCIEAIQEKATEAGYGIVLAVSSESAALERQHIERLLAMRVDGLLVSVSKQPPDLEVYERVRSMNMPLVFFDREIEDLGFSSVTVDDRKGTFQGVEYLIEQGYRKIAHVAGSSEVMIGRERRAGYEDALRKHGIPLHAPWIIEGGFDEWHGYEAFSQILRSGDIPEAVFAVTFPVSLGVRGAIREYAPELQHQLQILSFGEGTLSEFHTYPHLCINQPSHKIGSRAIELLLDEIESDGDAEPQQVVLDTNLILPSQKWPGQPPVVTEKETPHVKS